MIGWVSEAPIAQDSPPGLLHRKTKSEFRPRNFAASPPASPMRSRQECATSNDVTDTPLFSNSLSSLLSLVFFARTRLKTIIFASTYLDPIDLVGDVRGGSDQKGRVDPCGHRGNLRRERKEVVTSTLETAAGEGKVRSEATILPCESRST